MGILGVSDILASAYLCAGRTQKTAAGGADFIEQLQKTGKDAGTSKADTYQEYLKQRYGNVSVQDVGKDQSSMDRIGAGTSGTGNVIIAPNILKQMENDPEKAAYYEKKIQEYFASVPRFQAELSMMGHEVHSSGIVIHPDGTVTHYISGDLKPEVRAKIEAKIKAEDEEKAKRKRQFRELSQEAAQKRRLEMESVYRHRSMTELLAIQAAETERVIYTGTPDMISSVSAAYEMNTVSMPDALT